jgi:hypothetical protein
MFDPSGVEVRTQTVSITYSTTDTYRADDMFVPSVVGS